MDLNNEFTVNVPIGHAWGVLVDVEAIAPCLPGAQLQEIEGEEYRGIVKVKVGPITAQYKGQAVFIEKDEVAHRIVLKAEGRDTRGQGNASAIITAELVAASETSTMVTVHTDLTVTGKVAQFGRSVMADVSAKLMAQFADNLSTTVLGAVPAPIRSEGTGATVKVDTSAPQSSNGTVRRVDQPEAEPIDLVVTAGASVLKRTLPAIGALVLLTLIIRILRRRG